MHRDPYIEAARTRRVFLRAVGARVPQLVDQGFVERAREYAPGAGDDSVLLELDQDLVNLRAVVEQMRAPYRSRA